MIKTVQIESVEFINDPTHRCTDCSYALNNPYRRYNNGQITEGCVSESHTGHLEEGTPSAAWHSRADAVKIRASRRVVMADYVCPPPGFTYRDPSPDAASRIRT